MRCLAMANNEEFPQREFGWSDMFVPDDADPRADGGWDNNACSPIAPTTDSKPDGADVVVDAIPAT